QGGASWHPLARRALCSRSEPGRAWRGTGAPYCGLNWGPAPIGLLRPCYSQTPGSVESVGHPGPPPSGGRAPRGLAIIAPLGRSGVARARRAVCGGVASEGGRAMKRGPVGLIVGLIVGLVFAVSCGPNAAPAPAA